MQILSISLFFGLISGLIYTILKIPTIILNSSKLAHIISDIISMLMLGFLFTYYIIKYNSGVVRLYIICAFALGFLIEIVSIGNLVDFFTKFIYNKLKVFLINLKTKLKTRRTQNGTEKIK